MDEEILYKKGKDQVLFRCVDASEAKRIVITVFPLDLDDHENKMESSPIFFVRV